MLHIKANDGTKLAVYDPNPSGSRCVLLIHGWPMSHKIFEYQEEFLLEKRVRVVTMDLRGFGSSDAPASGYSYNQMADDVFSVVRALGLGPFALGGFSMGGAVALRYMKNYAGYGVERLMLFAAAAPSWIRRPGFPCGVSKDQADQMIREAAADRPAMCRRFCREKLFAGEKSPAFIRWMEDICLSASGWGTVQAALSLRDENGQDDLSHVLVPAAIFRGEKDCVVPPDLTSLQAHRILHARLYSLRDSGHGVLWEEPDLFREYLTEFLHL